MCSLIFNSPFLCPAFVPRMRLRSSDRGSRVAGNKGVTCIDMVIAAMILALLALIVMPQFQSAMTQTKLNAASVELISALQYAGDMAATYQRPFALYIDTDENWFKVIDYQYRNDAGTHHDGDPPVDAYGLVLNPMNKDWFLKDYDTINDFEGVKITSGENVCFYPDGHSSDTNHTFVLSYGGEQRTITVNGGTRNIAVQ